MNKFSHEEGLTLIELLITLAVIAIVFAIAVPVFSNVLAGAQASADSAQAAALSSFAAEYATTTLVYANGVTTATLNGVQIASIKGDATSASTGNGGGNAAVVYSLANGDFSGYMGGSEPARLRSGFDAHPDKMALSIGNPSPALLAALTGLADGDTVTINGNAYTVATNAMMGTIPNGQTYSFIDDTPAPGGTEDVLHLNLVKTAGSTFEAVTTISVG